MKGIIGSEALAGEVSAKFRDAEVNRIYNGMTGKGIWTLEDYGKPPYVYPAGDAGHQGSLGVVINHSQLQLAKS